MDLNICLFAISHISTILNVKDVPHTVQAYVDGCFVKSTVIYPVGTNILPFIKTLLLFIVPITSHWP